MATHNSQLSSNSPGSTSSPPQTATLDSKPGPALPTPPTTPRTESGSDHGTDNTAHANIPTDAKMSSSQTSSHHHHHHHTNSHASIDTQSSHLSRKEYMDSLVPPSGGEMARIAQVQLERQKEEKRKGREKEKEARRSMDLSRSSLDVHQAHDGKPRRHSAILGTLRHKRSNSTNTRSRQSSIGGGGGGGGGCGGAAAAASVEARGDNLWRAEAGSGDHMLMSRAATMIQKTYRGYKTRREMKGLGLDADTRWTHAIREMKFREMVQPRGKEDVPLPVGTEASEEGLGADGVDAKRKSSSARYKWRKITTIASRAVADMDDDPTSESGSDSDSDLSDPEKRRKAHQKREEAKARRRKDARVMGLQYFLEMVDLKHRYGSNLRTYHEEWKKSDTKEPFFYWLDFGEGRNIDMASCPRERLDREQVRYLSREERQHYLVQVDSEGRLCWAKNGKRIDTTEEWKDSIHGIVPVDDPTPAFQPKITGPNQHSYESSQGGSNSPGAGSSSPISNASSSELEAARAAKYASPGVSDAKGYKKVTHLSASTILNTLLRKSVRKNTWIFVADTAFRLYVGIKDSGAFQHSSFVQGSRISAAGLIKIKQGRLASLSPLSGHYRPPASNFRAFVRSLKEEGVDMSRVSISKSYAVLVGLEMYMKTQQKGKHLLERAMHRKDKLVHPEMARRREDEARDTSESAEKERQFLERQRAEVAAAEEDSKQRSAARVIQKLGIGSSAGPLEAQGPPSESRVADAVEEQVEEEEKAEAEERAEADEVKAAAEAAASSAVPGNTSQGCGE
ncbi:unnamed protein product [Discula destructiva]